MVATGCTHTHAHTEATTTEGLHGLHASFSLHGNKDRDVQGDVQGVQIPRNHRKMSRTTSSSPRPPPDPTSHPAPDTAHTPVQSCYFCGTKVLLRHDRLRVGHLTAQLLLLSATRGTGKKYVTDTTESGRCSFSGSLFTLPRIFTVTSCHRGRIEKDDSGWMTHRRGRRGVFEDLF